MIQESCINKFTSCRWVIGYLCCAARFSQSAIRQCIGMAVVCMTVQTPATVPSVVNTPLPPTLPPLPPPAAPAVAAAGAGEAVAGAENGGVAGGGGVGGVHFNLGLDNISSSPFSSSTSSSFILAGRAAEVRFSEFTWSPEFEGLVLNAFNIGFFFSPILGGHIAGKFGAKRVILVALLVGGMVTVCLPLAARHNDIFVFVLRAFAGMFLGVVDPAIQALWSRWAPKHEKAQLTTCSYTGLSLAGILTFFISGHLCQIELQNGWPFIFYFFGGLALVTTLPWMLLVFDSPDLHPRITLGERTHIAKGNDHQGASDKKLKTPWKGMLTSGPLWAIVVAHMTYSWVTSWMMAYLPKYLSDVMEFDIDEDGLYSSLPYVGRLVSGLVASYVSDQVIRSGRLSTTATRKLFQTTGSLLCAVCTLAVGFVDQTSRAVAVTLLVLSMTFQNLTSVAFRINHLDIAPRFAGVMMGMTLTVAMAFSLTGPPITAAIIREGTTSEWMWMFVVVAAINVVGAGVFLVLASGEIQPWAQPSTTTLTPVCVATTSTLHYSNHHHQQQQQ